MIRLRAIWTLLALNKDLDITFKGNEPDEVYEKPAVPEVDSRVKNMMDAVSKMTKKEGDNADKLPEGGS